MNTMIEIFGKLPPHVRFLAACLACGAFFYAGGERKTRSLEARNRETKLLDEKLAAASGLVLEYKQEQARLEELTAEADQIKKSIADLQQKAITRVACGMKKKDVLRLLGPPNDSVTNNQGFVEMFYYGRATVRIERNFVTGVGDLGEGLYPMGACPPR